MSSGQDVRPVALGAQVPKCLLAGPIAEPAVTFGSWLRGQSAVLWKGGNDGYKKQRCDMTNAVVHFEIGAQDSTKIRTFYTSLLGWGFDTTDPSYGVMDETDGGIGGGIIALMAAAYGVASAGLGDLMSAPAVFACNASQRHAAG